MLACLAAPPAALAGSATLLQVFQKPTPAVSDQLGYAVAFAGNQVVIGARFDDTGGVDAGAGYLFDADSGDLVRAIGNPSPTSSGQFGFAVAGVGGRALLGAPIGLAGGQIAGAAYLHDVADGTLLTTLLDPGTQSDAHFGWSVAMVGTKIVVGAPLDDTNGADAGAVYVFDAATGAFLQQLAAPTPAAGDWFGYAVAGVGDDIVVGAPLVDAGSVKDAGAAYVFDGTSGALLHTFSKSNPGGFDAFGWSVASVGDTVLIGAPFDDTAAPNGGAVYLFSASTGGLTRTIKNPATSSSQFGWALATQGPNLVVGAPFEGTDSLPNAGAIYLFDPTNGAQLLRLEKPPPTAFDGFGYAVAAAGSRVLVGAPFDDQGEANAGAAYLFEVSAMPTTTTTTTTSTTTTTTTSTTSTTSTTDTTSTTEETTTTTSTTDAGDTTTTITDTTTTDTESTTTSTLDESATSTTESATSTTVALDTTTTIASDVPTTTVVDATTTTLEETTTSETLATTTTTVPVGEVTTTTLPTEEVCSASDPLACDDGDPCTTDSCDPSVGCSNVPLGGFDAVNCRLDPLGASLRSSPVRALGGRRLAGRLRGLAGRARTQVASGRARRGRRGRLELRGAEQTLATLVSALKQGERRGRIAPAVSRPLITLASTAARWIAPLRGKGR